MAHKVVFTPRAKADLESIYRCLRRAAPDAARTWLKEIRRTIKTLDKLPERGRLAPEAASFHEPIRELLHGRCNSGTYRILYVLLEGTVFVLHIRHGSMLADEPHSGELF